MMESGRLESPEDIIIKNIQNSKILKCVINELLDVYIKIGHPNPQEEDVFIDEVLKKFSANEKINQDRKLRAVVLEALREESGKINRKAGSMIESDEDEPLAEHIEIVNEANIPTNNQQKPRNNGDASDTLTDYEYFLTFGERRKK